MRNRIWHYALCGNVIHINGRLGYKRTGIGTNYAICRAKIDDKDVAAAIKAGYGDKQDSDSTSKGYTPTHEQCTFCTWACKKDCEHSRLPLSLLAACRQVHDEAALLPYTGNTFSLAIHSVEPFLKALVPAQAHAIERMILVVDREHHTKSFKTLLRRKLKGLKDIICFFETSCDVHDGTPFATRPELSTHLADTLLQFRQSPMAHAIVTIKTDWELWLWRRRHSTAARAEFEYNTTRQWARTLEEKLVASANNK